MNEVDELLAALPKMNILTGIPATASDIAEIQIQTKSSLMELERLLFFLTPMMTRTLRKTPKQLIRRRTTIQIEELMLEPTISSFAVAIKAK